MRYTPIIITFIIIILFGHFYYYDNGMDIEVGQVWVYESNRDPYQEAFVDTLTILSVSGDYCYYESKKFGRKSESRWFFKVGTRKIK